MRLTERDYGMTKELEQSFNQFIINPENYGKEKFKREPGKAAPLCLQCNQKWTIARKLGDIQDHTKKRNSNGTKVF